MRMENSIKNIAVALICSLINMIISFIAQNILVNTLGIEYSGLNGVFTNIISMLSIVELGLGTQIIYHLYKPIAENDTLKIRKLMNFYRKCYNTIAIVILLLGILITPWINFFVGNNNISENIYFVFLLFIFDASVSYLISYKRSILYANQKNRYVDFIHIIYILLVNGLQIACLLIMRNYIIYLIIKIGARIIENLLINFLANKMYPEVMKKNNEKLDKDVIDDIKIKIKALIFHQLGGYIVLGTDSIIISKFLGLAVAGIYSSYTLISNAANSFLSQIFSAVTGSVGDLLVENNKEKSYHVYKKMTFINFWIYGLAAIGMAFTINPLITLWLGAQYTFNDMIAIILALNFYMQGMRRTLQVFAYAGGICYENRYVPIIESIVNFVVSILLVMLIGLPGVIVGTIVSTFVLHFYGFPKYIYKPLFNRERIDYILEFLKYTAIICVTFILVFFIINFISVGNVLQQLIIRIIICLVIINLVFYILFRKTDEFKYYMSMIKNILNHRLIHKGEK